MSSHREAPEISKDPVADSTDVYAFVSPDRSGSVTLIANYIPLQNPAGGPNFFEFGDDVLYEIHIDNDGDGRADVTYQFEFTTHVRYPDSFLYNIGPILDISSANWNRFQTYTLTRVEAGHRTSVLGRDLRCPPCNIGPLSTPKYDVLAAQAVHGLGKHRKVFAGQRAEGFYVDLGAIFDLADLRPFQNLHNQYGMSVFTDPAPGVNTTKELNVHSLALQVPISDLTRGGYDGHDVDNPCATIGVWTTASRRRARVLEPDTGRDNEAGPYVQVSRLGNPLFNEVLVPMGKKDQWNALPPSDDKRFAQVRRAPGAVEAAAVALPRGVPESGRAQRHRHAARRPAGDPAHRHPGRRRARLPEPHRRHAGRHAAAQRRGPAGRRSQHPRPHRR